METGRHSSHSSLETATLLENLGSCCEGTVFTFTSAGSKWRLRQRLNRSKAILLNPNGGPLLTEDPADSVFTEMRMMPRSSETNPDGEDLWNSIKCEASRGSEEPGRANETAYDDNGDLRSYRRICSHSSQLGGEQRAKAVPQEAVKGDHERKELLVFVGETTPRKSRRYLRCDNIRDRHRYVDVGEDTTWLWNEKKLEDVRAQEERRRNKRESCAEEIHVFEQRKVKCRRKEQDSCSSYSESMQSEDVPKSDDVKRASNGPNLRPGFRVAEEPKKQQEGQVVAIRGPSTGTAGEIEDRRTNYLPKEKLSPQFHHKRGNAVKENRACVTPRPEIISPPIACSFISFKAGVPCVGNRKYHISGDASLRARPFSDEEFCDGNETYPQTLSQNRQDDGVDARSSPPHRNGSSVELASQSINEKMVGKPHVKRDEIQRERKSTGRDRKKERALHSETEIPHSSIDQQVSLRQKALNHPPPQEIPYSWSVRIREGSLDRGGHVALRWSHNSNRGRRYNNNSKPKYSVTDEGECRTQRIHASRLNPPKLKEEHRERMPSRSLDWYRSFDVEDASEVTDVDGSDKKSIERDSEEEFASCRGTDGPPSVQERAELCDDISEGSLDEINGLHLAEVSPEHSDAPNNYTDDANGDKGEIAPDEVANDAFLNLTPLELERRSFREAEKGISDVKQSTESSSTSRAETGKAETIETDPLPQKSLPLRRQPWVKGFKRKTGEKVGYFESWLGRRKKDLNSRKPCKTPPRGKCGPNGAADSPEPTRMISSDIKAVAANLETENGHVHASSKAGCDSLSDCGDQGSSLVAGVPIDNAGQANQRKQTQEEREDALPLSHSSPSGDDLRVASEGQSLVPQNAKEYRPTSEKGVKSSLKDVSSQKQETPPSTADAQGLSTAEQCRFLFEKRCTNQDSSLSGENNKVAEGMKPPFPRLTALSDNTDKPVHEVLETVDVAVGEWAVLDRFGALAMISGPANNTNGSRIESGESCPSEVATGSRNCPKAVDRPGPAETPDYDRVKGSSTAFSEQATIAGIPKHGKQVKSSCNQVLQDPSESKSSQLIIGSESKSGRTDGHVHPLEATGEFEIGLTESESVLNVADSEHSSANVMSKVDIDQSPSSVEPLAEKEPAKPDKRKESPGNRRHKTPIIVRVRNRLANGWLLQHPLWKRVAKQKMKTGESQVLSTRGTKGTNRTEVQAEPSTPSFGKGSGLNSLRGLRESTSKNVINTNPASRHHTELTITSMPQISVLEEHYNQLASTASENFGHTYSGTCSGNLDTCIGPSRIYDIPHRRAASEMYEAGEKSETNSMKSQPAEDHDGGEDNPMQKDYCHDQPSLVVSFAEWSRAAGFRTASPSRDQVGINSAIPKDRKEESYEFNNGGELLSIVCLGNCVKEATVLGSFSEFELRSEVPVAFGQGREDYGGCRLVSRIDGSDEETTPLCAGKWGKISRVSQPSSDSIADEHTINSISDALKCNYRQTEPLPKDAVLEEKQAYTPQNSPANTSLENCCPSVEGGAESEEGAGPEESLECESLQKYFPLNDQSDDLNTSSSLSSEHGCCEGSPYISGRMRALVDTGDAIDEQTNVVGQNDMLYFPPQVQDVLDRLSAEPTLDESAPSAPFECQPCLGTADEDQPRFVPKIVQPLGQSAVEDPFCSPLKVATSGGKELPREDGPVKETKMEHVTRFAPQARGMQEEELPASSFPSAYKAPENPKDWELMELLKMPNNQKQLSHVQKLNDLSKDVQRLNDSSADSQEHVSRVGQHADEWESSSQKDCSRTHGALCWKAEPSPQTVSDVPTEEQIFLERFSGISKEAVKPCKLPPKSASSRSGIIELLPSSVRPSPPDLGLQVKLPSAPARLTCGRAEPMPLGRSFNAPPPLPSDVQLINPLPSCNSKRSSLSDVGRPGSSQEYKHESYSAFESRLLSDYTPSFDCLSTSSSINRSLDIMEGHFTRAHPCPDCLNRYEHREAWVQGGADLGADGLHDWKSSSSQECVPSLTMHGASFPAQCQSMVLNPRHSSCDSHVSQSSTPCRCDPCNSTCPFSPSVLLGCHHPRCLTAVQHHSQCLFPGHSQPWECHKSSVPYVHGPSAQCRRKETPRPYSPLQAIQTSGIPTPRSWCHGDPLQPVLPQQRHQFGDKSRAAQNCQAGGQSQSNQAKGADSEKGLVWLSEHEMNLIQQLRLSGEKAAAVCRHDAAVCIQRSWRKHFEKKTTNRKLSKGQEEAALSLPSEYRKWHDHSEHCRVCQAAASLRLCGSSTKELSHEHVVQRGYTAMQKAASVIQHAWRSVLSNRNDKLLKGREWPKDLKTFYDIIKVRLLTRGRPAPSFELFSRSVQRIQAATEGARVRRRLKSHRLQTIVMEIKEIRMLLCEMSLEETSNSTPFLFPQLCTQLRQKISQLHTALNGKQMEARFLLRRCPATPLTMPSTRSTSPKPIHLVPSQKSVSHAPAKLSSKATGARKFYNPPLTNPASGVSDSTIAQSHSPTTQPAAGLPDQRFVHTQSFVPLTQAPKGNTIPLLSSSPDPPDSTEHPQDSAKLLQLYLLAQRQPSKRVGGQGTPNTDASSAHGGNPKREVMESNSHPNHKRYDLQSFSGHKASPKSRDAGYSVNNNFDEQPLPVPQRRKTPDMSFEEMAVGISNAGMYLTEYAPSSETTDKPKRPFLKRKSIAMPSQKLDWSKVKPMVSSRLEPELKTKLSLCKGPTKEPPKATSKKKKANYSNVKSRLFSYEENVSPSNSRDGTCSRSHTTENIDSAYPPPLQPRSSARGSSVRGSENGRYSRTLATRQRAVSPDLMHLRSSMAEADRLRAQASIVETQSVATYSSQFDSARYLHKVGNSKPTAKGTVVGSCQQRTQKSIRLRIVPGSKECPVGDLFVQEETQEVWEDHSLSGNGKGKRQQSHSHRYAIYQEQDSSCSSRDAETALPDSADEERKVATAYSRKWSS